MKPNRECWLILVTKATYFPQQYQAHTYAYLFILKPSLLCLYVVSMVVNQLFYLYVMLWVCIFFFFFVPSSPVWAAGHHTELVFSTEPTPHPPDLPSGRFLVLIPEATMNSSTLWGNADSWVFPMYFLFFLNITFPLERWKASLICCLWSLLLFTKMSIMVFSSTPLKKQIGNAVSISA